VACPYLLLVHHGYKGQQPVSGANALTKQYNSDKNKAKTR
jgi:hypothetical protein